MSNRFFSLTFGSRLTAAAALCASVGFSIESANIVGYQEVAVPAGSSMRTATFKAISGDYKISDIKVSDTVVGGGNDMIQKINADGSWGDLYYYLTLAGTGYVEDGWYKDDYGGEAVTDSDVLAPGESVMFSAVSGLNLTFPAAL